MRGILVLTTQIYILLWGSFLALSEDMGLGIIPGTFTINGYYIHTLFLWRILEINFLIAILWSSNRVLKSSYWNADPDWLFWKGPRLAKVIRELATIRLVFVIAFSLLEVFVFD